MKKLAENPERQAYYEAMWKTQFEHLQKFKRLYGRWPQPTERFPGRSQLGQWMYRNRQAWFEKRLSEDKVDRLRRIGCTLEPIRHIDAHWENQFTLLKKFRTIHPYRWPYTAEQFPEGNKLGRWFHEQRMRHTRGTLKKPYQKRLKSIRFPFLNVINHQDKWKLRYEELKNFRKKHPQKWPSSAIRSPQEHILWVWSHAQRNARNQKRLSKERIQCLDAIGFDWEPEENKWQEMFKALKEFFRKNPNRVPSAKSPDPKERSLAAWRAFQRKRNRRGVLEPHRKKLLRNYV